MMGNDLMMHCTVQYGWLTWAGLGWECEEGLEMIWNSEEKAAVNA